MYAFLENLKRKLTENDIKFKINRNEEDKIYVFFRNTKLYFCIVTARIVKTSRYINEGLLLSCMSPFPEVEHTFYCSDDALTCIKNSMGDERATECWNKYIGITNSSDIHMRELSSALCNRFISKFLWHYHANEIYVMHSNGMVICSVNYDYGRRRYNMEFYSPFKCNSYNNDNRITCALVDTMCTIINDVADVYDNKTINEMEECKMPDTETTNTCKKHTKLDGIYDQIKKKQQDDVYKDVELRIINREDNCIKYINVSCGGRMCGEIIGLFNTNGQKEVLLCIDYLSGDSWIEFSIDDGVKFIRRLLSENTQAKAISEIKKKYLNNEKNGKTAMEIGIEDGVKFGSAVCVSLGRRNGKMELLYESIWNKLTLSNKIENVIFQDPATIVFWKDNTKTVVKCQNGEAFDPEKGLAMAVAKKVFGNNRDYYRPFLKWIKKYNKQKFEEALEEAKKIVPDEIIHNGARYVLCTEKDTTVYEPTEEHEIPIQEG